MNKQLLKHLNESSIQLNLLALSHPDEKPDMSAIMSALALTMQGLMEVLDELNDIRSQMRDSG